MIYFVLDKKNSFTINNYKAYRGLDISERIGIIHYHEIEKLNNLHATTIIFSDLDYLAVKQLKRVELIANELNSKYPKLNLLNHPGKIKRRYELLRALYLAGINSFNVYRINEPWDNLRYPVFLREENNHTGTLSSLLHDEKEIKRSIAACLLLGYSKNELLIVEFCDIQDTNGIRNKYSAINLNGKITPMFFDLNKDWVVKANAKNGVTLDHKLNYYWEYLKTNPHNDKLKKVFEIANIDYGRIDYGVKEDNHEVWEINFNPAFLKKKKQSDPEMDKIYKFSHKLMIEEFIKLDSVEPSLIELDIPNGLGKKLKLHWINRFNRIIHNNFNTKIKIFQWALIILIWFSLQLARVFILFPFFDKLLKPCDENAKKNQL